MKTNLLLSSIIFILSQFNSYSQSPAWERQLKMAWSNDGITFNTPTIFQDSSGVPSVIKWKGDTLICAFQWFPAPFGSPSWDRVAVKFSYDNGITWTAPVPIIVNGLPANYQRTFDPTLAAINNDSIRIYFSSSDGMPVGGLDSTVNTYSAKSADGINYTFEANARVDQLNNKVIDPAVIYFNNSWHYTAPIGAPQEGAYHYVSPDGLNFSQVSSIPSDMMHNWTGNFIVDTINELRFYGCSSQTYIWYNSTSNGGIWNGYVNTNLIGGDPSAVKTSGSSYLIIYVGEPNMTGINEHVTANAIVYPDPALESISVSSLQENVEYHYVIYSLDGKELLKGNSFSNLINVKELSSGMYFLILKSSDELSDRIGLRFLKE